MKKSLLTVALMAITAVASLAQGTINPLNGTLTRVRVDDGDGLYSSTDRAATAADQITVGIFWGAPTPGSTPETLIGELRLGATAGILTGAPALLSIAGQNAGSTISLQMRVLSGGIGQTDVKLVKLAADIGPGTAVWTSQGVDVGGSQTFRPLLVTIPEPSTIALGVLGLGSLLLFRRRK